MAMPPQFVKNKKGVGTKKAKPKGDLPTQGKAPAKAGPPSTGGPAAPAGPIDPKTLGSMTSSLKMK
jgi:hypothetical protein